MSQHAIVTPRPAVCLVLGTVDAVQTVHHRRARAHVAHHETACAICGAPAAIVAVREPRHVSGNAIDEAYPISERAWCVLDRRRCHCHRTSLQDTCYVSIVLRVIK